MVKQAQEVHNGGVDWLMFKLDLTISIHIFLNSSLKKLWNINAPRPKHTDAQHFSTNHFLRRIHLKYFFFFAVCRGTKIHNLIRMSGHQNTIYECSLVRSTKLKSYDKNIKNLPYLKRLPDDVFGRSRRLPLIRHYCRYTTCWYLLETSPFNEISDSLNRHITRQSFHSQISIFRHEYYFSVNSFRLICNATVKIE